MIYSSKGYLVLGEYRVFFSRSFRPRVSFTKNRQKKKPINVNPPKYQIEPYIFSSEFIMNSKENEMMIRLIY